MALGFNLETKSSGDILPIVKWDAKAGDFIKQDRYQAGDGTWQKDEAETLPLQDGVPPQPGKKEMIPSLELLFVWNKYLLEDLSGRSKTHQIGCS